MIHPMVPHPTGFPRHDSPGQVQESVQGAGQMCFPPGMNTVETVASSGGSLRRLTRTDCHTGPLGSGMTPRPAATQPKVASTELNAITCGRPMPHRASSVSGR